MDFNGIDLGTARKRGPDDVADPGRWLQNARAGLDEENGIAEAAKWQADLKAGLLTGAKAALIEGKSIKDAILAAIVHTLASNSDAAAGLNPSDLVLDTLAKAAVADAAGQLAASAANAVIAGKAGETAAEAVKFIVSRAK